MLYTTLSQPKIFQNLNKMDEFLRKSRITKIDQSSSKSGEL